MKDAVSFSFKSGLSDSALAQFGINVLTRMKDNPNFGPLQALVASELNEAVNRYTLAVQEAADGSRTKIAVKRAAKQQLREVLDRMAQHVNLFAAGQGALILESGFNLRSPATSHLLPLEQVQGLKVSQAAAGDVVVLTFNAVKQARMYAIEWSVDGGQQWQNGTYSTALRCVLEGLPARQEVLFRVTALGSKQRKSAPSMPVRFFIN